MSSLKTIHISNKYQLLLIHAINIIFTYKTDSQKLKYNNKKQHVKQSDSLGVATQIASICKYHKRQLVNHNEFYFNVSHNSMWIM